MRLFSQLRKKGKKRNNRSRNVRRPCRLEQLERREMLASVTGDFNGDGNLDSANGDKFADVTFIDSDGVEETVDDAGEVVVSYGQSTTIQT